MGLAEGPGLGLVSTKAKATCHRARAKSAPQGWLAGDGGGTEKQPIKSGVLRAMQWCGDGRTIPFKVHEGALVKL